jgi:hypothetical protein
MSDVERAGAQQAAGPSPGVTGTVKRYRRAELDEEEERQKKALLLESEEAEDEEYVGLGCAWQKLLKLMLAGLLANSGNSLTCVQGVHPCGQTPPAGGATAQAATAGAGQGCVGQGHDMLHVFSCTTRAKP